MGNMLEMTKDIGPLKGNYQAPVQDAEAYQLDIAASADVHEAIRQGLEDVSHGRTRPAREVFEQIRQEHGIRRSAYRTRRT